MPLRIKSAAAAAAVIAAMTLVDGKGGPIKIGTIAPQGSIYVNALREMGEAWKVRTGGRLTYTVYSGGDNDTEESMLRNMRPNFRKLQVAQISAITLGNLDDAFNVFGLPMFYESYAEADRVLEKLGPELEKRLEAKGYKVLNSAYAGWIRVFSTQPVRTVEDLKKLKLYTSAGDDRLAKWYKANGFTAVPLDSTAIVTSLKTNMIEAVPCPPMFAQLLGWFETASYTMDIGFAPLMGWTLMSLDTFKALSAEDQRVVIEEARKTGDRLRAAIPRKDEEAMQEMIKRHLKVITVDRAEWRRMAEQLGESMRKDGTIPGDIYDIARRERDASRAAK